MPDYWFCRNSTSQQTTTQNRVTEIFGTIASLEKSWRQKSSIFSQFRYMISAPEYYTAGLFNKFLTRARFTKKKIFAGQHSKTHNNKQYSLCLEIWSSVVFFSCPQILPSFFGTHLAPLSPPSLQTHPRFCIKTPFSSQATSHFFYPSPLLNPTHFFSNDNHISGQRD